MSWWDIGEGDLVSGDRPADIAARFLSDTAQFRKQRGEPKPDLQEFLNALQAVLTRGLSFKEEALTVVAEDESLGTLRSQVGPAGEDLIASLDKAHREMTEVYIDGWQRKPDPREVMAAFEFILRYRPDRFLSHETPIRRICLKPAPGPELK